MQIKPGLHRVQSSDQVVYALECDGVHALMTFARCYFVGRTSVEALRANGIEPDRIAAVLIAHFHDDHCGGLAALRRACRPKVIAHRLSVEQTTMMPPN
jgi:glyoxylase-like metal-dependent hydrolase (beta-lactamase superfamily II)